MLGKQKPLQPKKFFKVDAQFIGELNKILIENFVIEKFRSKIISDFLKLIKTGIVKK